jgi:valyl-tRNA synthetase
MKVTDARGAVVKWLAAEGLLEKEEEIEHNISLAQRTGGVIEPLPKLQWFVAVNKEFDHIGKKVTLKSLMTEAVSSGSIKILPDRFEKVYFHWIENLRDWCISRQIWYGHRVPVWYNKKEGKDQEIFCGIDAPKGEGWKQDEDTLDTWFSSGLWTFSTLGWPEKTADLKTFHPTTILETGSDILFFWVARMILMSTYLLNEVPFKTVYLHGLVRDAKGRKISKSLGNNVDPLDMITKYGADAVRMSLIVGVGPGSDSKIGEDKIKAYKNFANKLWNITRFVLSNVERVDLSCRPELTEPDKQMIAEINEMIKEVTKHMDDFRFYLAAEMIYHYIWHSFADKYIEDAKTVLAGNDKEAILSTKWTLMELLATSLQMLHPFMPFVTEEIWSEMPIKGKSMLIVEKWPS